MFLPLKSFSHDFNLCMQPTTPITYSVGVIFLSIQTQIEASTILSIECQFTITAIWVANCRHKEKRCLRGLLKFSISSPPMSARFSNQNCNRRTKTYNLYVPYNNTNETNTKKKMQDPKNQILGHTIFHTPPNVTKKHKWRQTLNYPNHTTTGLNPYS